MRTKQLVDWILAIMAAVILLQTLRFKLTGAPESIYIFTTVGMEPYGRIGSALVELLAGVLLLIPRTRGWGALISLGVISGALFFHLTTLGIEVQNDGGLLFIMALVVFLCSIILLYLNKNQLPILKNF